MTQRHGSFMSRLFGRLTGERRGSVILLAVGVLGIISIAALSYVTIVRLDRNSAEAAATRENYQKQVKEVVSHLQELVTADLFGNKIVTDAVPLHPDPTTGFRSMPEMFEDGDVRDIPTVHLGNFRNVEQSTNGNVSPPDARLLQLEEFLDIGTRTRYELGYPDDAWLASNEPLWDTTDISLTEYWPQITNLRDGFYFNEGPSDQLADDFWLRRDGRYADLGQWFLMATNRYATASIDLLSYEDFDTTDDGRLGPQYGVNQPVFGHAINVMSRFTPPLDTSSIDLGAINPLTPRDERQWVDTDGDFRPDARWTQLERLGRRFGLEWVVAARIIDLSGKVNVNTAVGMTINTGANPMQVLGAGRTPAEIDIRRILNGSARINWNDGISGYPSRTVDNSFAHLALGEHLRTIGAGAVLDGMVALGQSGSGEFNPFDSFGPTTATLPDPSQPELDWTQRDAWWIGSGANHAYAVVPGATPIPDTSLVDLYTFTNTNHSGIVSPLETAFDGPEGNRLLPSIDPAVDDFGPMRSRELPAESRRIKEGVEEPIPTARQLHDSIRGDFTTISGQSLAGPVPLLNRRDKGFYREQSRPKINLALSPMAVKPNHPSEESGDGPDVQRTFESLVWALAPLATDQALSRRLADLGRGIGYDNPSPDAHYGGGLNGPARNMNFAAPNALAPVRLTDVESANFAVMVAAMMTANIRDAVDPDDEPTLIFLGNDNQEDGNPSNARSRKIRDSANQDNDTAGPNFEIGLSLAQGEINTVKTQSAGAAGQIFEPTDSTVRDKFTLITGLDRQPFITEVTTMAFYGHQPDGSGAGSPVLTTNEAIGSALIVQLANPWFGSLSLNSDWSIAIVRPGGSLGDSMTAFQLELSEDVTIPAGESFTLYWAYDGGAGTAGSEISNKIDEKVLSLAPVVAGNTLALRIVEEDPSATAPVPFAGFEPGSSVVLIHKVVIDYDDTGTPQAFADLIVDRITAPVDVDNPFPVTIETAAQSNGFTPGQVDLGVTGTVPNDVQLFDTAYFLARGYTPGPPPPLDPRFNSGEVIPSFIRGRVGLTSNLSRSGVRASDPSSLGDSGFPAYVFEQPSMNTVTTRRRGHAWLDPTMGTNQGATAREDPNDIVDPVIPEDGLNLGAAGTESVWQLNDPVKGFNGHWTNTEFLPFKLYLPNNQGVQTRFDALSDLHLISCYATTCLNWGSRDKLDAWSTLSEKLAQSRFYDHATPGGHKNPYIGVLDPSRYIIGGQGMQTIPLLPDALTVPLALRVFDCFEVLPISTPLVQGRVNINTASQRVIDALPFMNVNRDIIAAAGTLKGGTSRAELVRKYRLPDPQFEMPATNEREINITKLSGLRPGNPRAVWFSPSSPPDEPPTVGFQTAAELAILDQWQTAGNGLPDPDPLPDDQGFLARVADAAATGAMEKRPFELSSNYGVPENDPANDPEERLAVYRALSNIVSVRSDVFLAWFVIRAYDPQAIELIPATGSADNRLKAMDDPRYDFGPVYETRWLAVLDRSNVKRPTDRARVVMLVEIPRATP